MSKATNLRIGWHGDYYWTGLYWHTREKCIQSGRRGFLVKCVGSGLTQQQAEQDLQQALSRARKG